MTLPEKKNKLWTHRDGKRKNSRLAQFSHHFDKVVAIRWLCLQRRHMLQALDEIKLSFWTYQHLVDQMSERKEEKPITGRVTLPTPTYRQRLTYPKMNQTY